MGFRHPQTIIRTSSGDYADDGMWSDGGQYTFVIYASVQPAGGEDVSVLPAGKRLSDFVKAYTATELQVLDEINGLQPDRLVWRNNEYECISADVRQMGVINHYKYIFSRVTQ